MGVDSGPFAVKDNFKSFQNTYFQYSDYEG